MVSSASASAPNYRLAAGPNKPSPKSTANTVSFSSRRQRHKKPFTASKVLTCSHYPLLRLASRTLGSYSQTGQATDVPEEGVCRVCVSTAGIFLPRSCQHARVSHLDSAARLTRAPKRRHRSPGLRGSEHVSSGSPRLQIYTNSELRE